MSRSRKKAIVKDNGISTSEYWKPIRRIWKQTINQFYKKERFGYWEFDDSLPNPKSLIDDYNYSDYTFDYEHDYNITNWWTKEDREKQRILLRRK